jgi:thiosulfate dehydrogenase (quinone) large subunit
MNRMKFDSRTIGVAVAGFVGAWLLVRATDFDGSASTQLLALVAGLALFVAALAVLMRGYKKVGTAGPGMIGEPRVAEFLFASVKSAPIWLGVRLYLGYAWLDAGRNKLGAAGWTASGDAPQRDGSMKYMEAGDSLKNYWIRAVGNPDAETPVAGLASWDVYRSMLSYMLDNGWNTWFNWVIVLGEIAIGVGLILGALTGIAAFFGAALNMTFLLAGTVSSNPILLIITMFVILAWRVAGWIGLDYFLLPKLGVPWQREVVVVDPDGAPAGSPAPGTA